MITHEPLHLAWWTFAPCTSTTSRTLLTWRSWVKGQGHVGFCAFLSAWYPRAVLSLKQRFNCYSSSNNDFNSLCDTADTQLFTNIHDPHHVLQALLPPPADRNYNLRDRLHNRQLPGRMSHLTNCNFIARMLFCDSHWLYCFILSCTVQLRFDNCCIKETFDLIWLCNENKTEVWYKPIVVLQRRWRRRSDRLAQTFQSSPQTYTHSSTPAASAEPP